MIYFVESSQSTDQCKTIDDPNRSASSNISCTFPFVYEGVEYNECVWDDKGAWCSTKTNNQNNHETGKEGACSTKCPIKPHSENQSNWIHAQADRKIFQSLFMYLLLNTTFGSYLVTRIDMSYT